MEEDEAFCVECGQPHAGGEAAPSQGSARSLKKLTDHTRKGISDWVMPVNAMITFATLTCGVLLDLLAPFGPYLLGFALVLLLVWLAGIAMRLMSPKRAEQLGWLPRVLGGTATPIWRSRQFWLTGVLAVGLTLFAFASKHAQAQGGFLASKSQTVKTWQQAWGLLDERLADIHAEQKVSNVLLQQGNENTGALRQGQQTQTKVLEDIRDVFGSPNSYMRLRAALWTGDLEGAKKILDAGGKYPLADVFQLAAMNQGPATKFMLEHKASIIRKDKDCEDLLAPGNAMGLNGLAYFNPNQVLVVKAFCQTGSLGMLEARAGKLEAELQTARLDPKMSQCVAFHQGRRPEYIRQLATSERLGFRSARCAFEQCDADDLLEFHSRNADKFAEQVRQKCIVQTADPVLKAQRAELDRLKAVIAALKL